MSYDNVMKFYEQIYRCNTCCRCPRGPWDPCQPDAHPTPNKQCPIYEYNGSLASSCHGMILIIRDLLEGKLEPTPELVAHMNECVLCEGCMTVCKGTELIPLGGIQGARIFRDLRADFVAMGLEVPEGLKKFTDLIAQTHSRQGVTKKERTAWADDLGIKDGGEIVIFAGCTASYQDDSSVVALAKILQKAEVDFGLLKDEWCCGSLQRDAGILDGFKESAEYNVAAIKASGAKKVVVTNATRWVSKWQ